MPKLQFYSAINIYKLKSELAELIAVKNQNKKNIASHNMKTFLKIEPHPLH